MNYKEYQKAYQPLFSYEDKKRLESDSDIDRYEKDGKIIYFDKKTKKELYTVPKWVWKSMEMCRDIV